MIIQSKTKGKRSFTPAQKQLYKAKKESEKEDLKALYEKFLEKKPLRRLLGYFQTTNKCTITV